jgi:hypothetical protein
VLAVADSFGGSPGYETATYLSPADKSTFEWVPPASTDRTDAPRANGTSKLLDRSASTSTLDVRAPSREKRTTTEPLVSLSITTLTVCVGTPARLDAVTDQQLSE